MPLAPFERIRALARHVRAPPREAAPASSSPARSPVLVLGERVRAALERGEPVVALESTIVAHGMPYPANIECALDVEGVIRANGATPATIAIIDGACVIGASREELEKIARLGAACAKCSRRDVAGVIARRETAATTVSATMLLARLAGIDVFVTGGIGGVHRGGERTMDVSADISELGRTDVAVVCAGAKSILDIPRTLEVMETHGVAVCGYTCDEFPAFFTRKSGCKCPQRVDTPEAAAQIVKATLDTRLGSGCVFAVPIPSEHEAVGEEIERATTTALEEAEARGVAGRDVTPFILKRVAELTGGRSLAANVALVQNNAVVGARIAVALAALKRA